MAENKTKPTAINVAAFLDACTDEARRADAKALAKLMQKVTGNEPCMWGPSIVGFGSRHYTYESGREGDMPIVGFSPRKAANVLYGTIGFAGAEACVLGGARRLVCGHNSLDLEAGLAQHRMDTAY